MTGVTEKLFMCQMFMCLFQPLLALKNPNAQLQLRPNFSRMHPSRNAIFFGQNLPQNIRDKSLHMGFCASGTRTQGRILGNEFWTPEHWTRILGSNVFFDFFSSKRGPLKNSPSRNSPPKIHLPKFNPEIGQKNHIAPLQGQLADQTARNYHETRRPLALKALLASCDVRFSSS